uniref:V-type proton ATPase proteolipid subunit n=1 Tax=Meloidogyne enterolobii TaxID=390850 RepID=A0A6V7W2A3_MELEN|nr:unnamed protein product [Meloidogyne enterolobii]
MSVARPDLVMKAIIPVVMAGIVAIYGLVVAVIISGKLGVGGKEYTVNAGFSQFAAGLVCGLCGLGAGYAIGIVGDSGVRGLAQQPRLFVGMILMLIFFRGSRPVWNDCQFIIECFIMSFKICVLNDKRDKKQKKTSFFLVFFYLNFVQENF